MMGRVTLDREVIEDWAAWAEGCLADVGWNPEDGWGHSLKDLIVDMKSALSPIDKVES